MQKLQRAIPSPEDIPAENISDGDGDMVTNVTGVLDMSVVLLSEPM
jgi:hypothetical protein